MPFSTFLLHEDFKIDCSIYDTGTWDFPAQQKTHRETAQPQLYCGRLFGIISQIEGLLLFSLMKAKPFRSSFEWI